VCDSEAWAMKIHDLRRLEMAKNTMLRRMCGVTLKERTRTAELINCLGVVSVEEVVTHGHGRVCGG